MYHYRESGLPHVFLENGYRKLKTRGGVSVAIEDVEGLHRAISETIVNEFPFLNGPEVRFLRNYLGLSQVQMAANLGVDEQTIRRWEKLSRVPKQGEVALRLLFRDMTGGPRKKNSLPELLSRLAAATPAHEIRYSFTGAGKDPWRPTLLAA
jgi:putative transcriptional regulator